MAKNKTQQTTKSVANFISAVDGEVKHDDSYQLIDILKTITGFEPAMWGPSIIGFGSNRYKYDSGHEGDMSLIGFSPRKTAIVLYIMGDFPGKDELFKKLGKHKASKACVYVKKLEDINVSVLKKIIVGNVKSINKQHPS